MLEREKKKKKEKKKELEGTKLQAIKNKNITTVAYGDFYF